MKSVFLKLPEYYLIMVVLLAGYSTPFYIHPICVGIAVMFLLQALFKNKISGLLLGVLFFAINLYFIVALLSEFSEFPTFSTGAKKLLFIGLPIWVVNMVLSITMIYKYATNNSQAKLKEQHI